MQEPNILPEKDVFGLDKPQGGSPIINDPKSHSRTVRFTIILAIVALLIAAGMYFLQR